MSIASITAQITQPKNLVGLAIGTAIAGKFLYDRIFSKQVPKDTPFPSVPKYISQEAQAFLRTATPIRGTAEKTQEIWGLMRGGYRAATIEASDVAKEKYLETYEKSTIEEVPVYISTPKGYQPADKEKILLYLHGGAFCLGTPDHLCQIYAPIAAKTNCKAIAIDYRLAPEHPFPAGLNDCYNVYKNLVESHGAENIVLFGDSAGANLCGAVALKAQQEELALPAALGLCSPISDFALNGDSFETMKGRSPKIYKDAGLQSLLDYYSGEAEVENPLISIINGTYGPDFPPTTIFTGPRDALLSDCVRLVDKMKDTGARSELQVFPGMWHGWQEHQIPEAEKSAERMAAFFKTHLPASVEMAEEKKEAS